VNRPRRGEIWTAGSPPAARSVLVLSSTIYNELADEPTVLVALVLQNAAAKGFSVALGAGQWAVMGLVTALTKTSLRQRERKVSTQALTDANNMLFRILATPSP